MKCQDTCLSGALETSGEFKSADEVINEVEKDRLFYENSGGGMTLSGGEPLFQFDFALEILKKATEPVYKKIREKVPPFADFDASPFILLLGLFFIARMVVVLKEMVM